MSSCSPAWGWVLHQSLSLLLSFIVVRWSVPIVHPSPSWGWVLLVCFVPVVPLPLVIVQSWCTCHPPDEQLLIGMGVGAGAGAGSAPSPSSLVVVQPWCTHHPPDEQLLVSVWVGVCFVIVVPVLVIPRSPFHP
jgi:hypothetical protein